MENIILYALLIVGWLSASLFILLYRRTKNKCNEFCEGKKKLEALLTKEQQENLDKEKKLQNLLHIEGRFYKILPALVEERKQKIDELLIHYALQCNLLHPLYVAQKNEIRSQIIKMEELIEDIGFNELFEQIKLQLIELKKNAYKFESEQLFAFLMMFLESINKEDDREKIELNSEGLKKIEQFYQNYIEEIKACEFKGKTELVELKKKLLVLLLCYKEFKILHLYYIIWGKNIENNADTETHKKQIENYKPEVLEKTKFVKEKYCN